MKLKKNIAISETGFVFDPARGESFTTNSIGAHILNLLQDGKELKAIYDSVIATYEIDQATCEKDVYDFINMLEKNGLLA